ncbi:transcriptional regulator, TraR/DksA family [Rubellimicrobium thermophilum DSM 16684]|uniref:Transcriptional regulator, TraR/DksA family n=1 Tax=Rubellimicrobium thermophilum DSM 16684 TaxID=1123069 RepID=S9S0M7_9RHOB|nr:TraR/DksA C4-type zinc finger protein [Rubellimicrobium thermophilum]EPX83785.1 transcriptional regulator, TraR/DksA family [Rubellimicrobium thermophilum DSM 16684]
MTQDAASLFAPRLRAELEELRAASAGTAADRVPVALDQQSIGRLSRQDALQMQAMAAAQEARRLARIRAIEAALRRIAAGEYGFCESCAAPIPERRLAIDPVLTRCVGCAR